MFTHPLFLLGPCPQPPGLLPPPVHPGHSADLISTAPLGGPLLPAEIPHDSPHLRLCFPTLVTAGRGQTAQQGPTVFRERGVSVGRQARGHGKPCRAEVTARRRRPATGSVLVGPRAGRGLGGWARRGQHREQGPQRGRSQCQEPGSRGGTGPPSVPDSHWPGSAGSRMSREPEREQRTRGHV